MEEEAKEAKERKTNVGKGNEKRMRRREGEREGKKDDAGRNQGVRSLATKGGSDREERLGKLASVERARDAPRRRMRKRGFGRESEKMVRGTFHKFAEDTCEMMICTHDS